MLHAGEPPCRRLRKLPFHRIMAGPRVTLACGMLESVQRHQVPGKAVASHLMW